MFEQTRSVFNDEYRGVPNNLVEGAEKHNRLWGSDFIFFPHKELNEDDVEALVDWVLFLRALS